MTVLRRGDKSYTVECTDCTAFMVCAIERDEMDISGLGGWTTPPVRCPKCSARAAVGVPVEPQENK